MKKNIIFLISVLLFAFYGCSDSQNLTDLNSLFTAKAVLSSYNSNADKILVELEFTEPDTRTLMPTFYENGTSGTVWTAELTNSSGETFTSAVSADNFGRYWFYVTPNTLYKKIIFTGINTSECYYDYGENYTVKYSAILENLTFSLEEKKSVKASYSIESVTAPEGVEYYSGEGKLAQITISEIPTGFEISQVKGILKSRDTETSYNGEYNPDGHWWTFSVSSEDDVEEGLYDFIMTFPDEDYYNFYIGNILFSNYEPIKIVKNNYVEADFTFLDASELYKPVYYATMNSSATGDGSSSNFPKYINDVYDLCLDESNKYRSCTIYCDNDFVLDYDKVYGTDGISTKIDCYSTNCPKLITVVTSKTQYLLECVKIHDDDAGIDENVFSLSIYGDVISLSGNHKFEIESLKDRTGTYSFDQWKESATEYNDTLMLNLYNGAYININDSIGSDRDIYVIVNISADTANLYTEESHPFFSKQKLNTDFFRLLINGVYEKLGDGCTYSLAEDGDDVSGYSYRLVEN